MLQCHLLSPYQNTSFQNNASSHKKFYVTRSSWSSNGWSTEDMCPPFAEKNPVIDAASSTGLVYLQHWDEKFSSFPFPIPIPHGDDSDLLDFDGSLAFVEPLGIFEEWFFIIASRNGWRIIRIRLLAGAALAPVASSQSPSDLCMWTPNSIRPQFVPVDGYQHVLPICACSYLENAVVPSFESYQNTSFQNDASSHKKFYVTRSSWSSNGWSTEDMCPPFVEKNPAVAAASSTGLVCLQHWDEKFSSFPFPIPIPHGDDSDLLDFDGSLAFVVYSWYGTTKLFRFWIMNVKDGEITWIRNERLDVCMGGGARNPLGFSKNGSSLLLQGMCGELLEYDYLARTLKCISEIVNYLPHMNLCSYVETTVQLINESMSTDKWYSDGDV
ncbi:hypothetical protein C2S53_007404 [Perilla frutescens var. hirtella]|uniref:F-box protein n=1 Tax=Perilla frutescens var. hirtella TaxID=608512 RepID=A0AAD4JMT6_PERFH|nr:hypothetical protein C2S53_007404 [Perilla frutescens var. hirtella]